MDNSSTYLIRFLWDLNDLVTINLVNYEHCPAHSRHSVSSILLLLFKTWFQFRIYLTILSSLLHTHTQKNTFLVARSHIYNCVIFCGSFSMVEYHTGLNDKRWIQTSGGLTREPLWPPPFASSIWKMLPLWHNENISNNKCEVSTRRSECGG